jgi:hypothetical protein
MKEQHQTTSMESTAIKPELVYDDQLSLFDSIVLTIVVREYLIVYDGQKRVTGSRLKCRYKYDELYYLY